MGIQDFDPKVQEAVNRIQPASMVKDIYEACRTLKFHSINFDLIYGLPHQTQESFSKTIKQVIQLKPDRIALYSFALVPWIKKQQTILNEEDLPTPDEKLEIYLQSREQLLESGYDAIAMDHFALKNDEMAKAFHAGNLYRNFMGYTCQYTDDFLGLGVSSIGFLKHTFVQNTKDLKEYYKHLSHGHLPTERGKVLAVDDRARQWAINALMCQFQIDKQTFKDVYKVNFDLYFKQEQEHLQKCAQEKLIELEENKITVTDLGKLFIRNICMGFDWYLRQKNAHKKFSNTI